MSAKGCLNAGETTFIWMLAFISHLILTTAIDGAGRNSPAAAAAAAASTEAAAAAAAVARHRPDDHESSSPKSATRVLNQCQVICQGNFCWDLCERSAENGNRDKDKIFPRRRRHAANIGPSRDRRPSYASPTAAAAVVEEVSSGSGVGTESMSSVRGDYVSGESRRRSQTIESTSVGHVVRGSSGAQTVFINMTVKVEQEKTGERYAVLHFRLGSELNWANGTIRVHLASESCNLDPSYPHCIEPNRHQSYLILADSNKWMKYRFAGYLMFNAEYWAKIEVGHVSSPQYYFKTPGCSRLDRQNPRRCNVEPNTFPKKDPPHPALLIRIMCMEYYGHRGDDMVSIDIQWRVDPPAGSNDHRWNSSVLVFLMPDKNPLLTKMTERQEARLDLMVNRLYEILVCAKSKDSEIVYVPLIFNASVERVRKLSNRLTCPTTGAPVVPATGRVNAVLIGSLVFVSLSMSGIFFFVYRKCRGKHMKKTAISEANSYKSSPSGSLRLLREGQAFNTNVDEWEIDAREVSLGVEIGQGAFGRVLTGYYRDKEIAIKVLRENIPEFYREDLLREIYLMKGLGYHPNIVTMLGACTIREPIALIVEYMPFGNLQTFLKKCRLDRETQTPDKRGEMLYCLLDEMTGVKESWQIAPTDILSFARQVVLAMQYLAERHYVHRDLAARNVLLGNNKVVKVCDFGLARMVYAGDQYFKLTSGRLPLKWMALESIRDRVFTTYSDVWSFGVLLWEMVTLGASPYPGIALVDLYRLLAEGYRMQQPVNCSDELYDIISQCWCENPTDRPPFARIRCQLEALLARNVDYLDLDNIDIPLNHSDKDDVDGDGAETSGAKDRLLATHDNVCIC